MDDLLHTLTAQANYDLILTLRMIVLLCLELMEKRTRIFSRR